MKIGNNGFKKARIKNRTCKYFDELLKWKVSVLINHMKT